MKSGSVENALLLRAEHHQTLGETSEALQYRRFAQHARKMKLGNFKIVGHRGTIW